MTSSHLTDEEYSLVEPLLPAEDHRGGRGRPFLPHRSVLEGILWIHRTGAPWRDLPPAYGKWSTVYERFRRWRAEGLFPQILTALQSAGRKDERIDFEFSAPDGSGARAHRGATAPQGRRRMQENA